MKEKKRKKNEKDFKNLRKYDYFMVYNWCISFSCYGKTNWPTYTCMYCLLQCQR